MSANFDRFWTAWPAGPRKVNKIGCEKKWKLKHLDAKTDAILWHVEWSIKNNPQWKSGEFIPSPLVYINQERWEDGTFQAEQKKKFGQQNQTPRPDTRSELPEMSRYRHWWNRAMWKFTYGTSLKPIGSELLAKALAKRDEICGMAERDGDWLDADFVDVGMNAMRELFGRESA